MWVEKKYCLLCLVLVVSLLCQDVTPAKGKNEAGAGWKAGVAKAVITPEEPIWMAGYASRNKPSEGKIQDLYAKALALEDPQGRRLVIVTTDLIGFSHSIAEKVAAGGAKANRIEARSAHADVLTYPHRSGHP